MRKLLTLILVLASLAGCTGYRTDVQQGNVITQEMVERLEPDMSKEEVRFILGSPPIVDPFHPDRWDYVYSFRPGGGERRQRRIAVIFEGGRLARIEGDVTGEGTLSPDTETRARPRPSATPVPEQAPRPSGPLPRPTGP
ncbi:MAG: outer membrane protein assembly factor BamE [Gammaproteobacteria bacterium]|nr:outer membrane protein assembly factor BamE [Gammaproteobacteria bacterium]NIR82973.1 outer membrane protein assembly factor BamE [Gammaproteobacteria bacterium]